jgi:hypothetical protein
MQVRVIGRLSPRLLVATDTSACRYQRRSSRFRQHVIGERDMPAKVLAEHNAVARSCRAEGGGAGGAGHSRQPQAGRAIGYATVLSRVPIIRAADTKRQSNAIRT